MTSNSRVIVIGGGVIGCSIAYHLAGAGVEVTLVERGKVGGGASGVAAGMIAALSEAIPVGHTLDLALMSRSLLLDMLPQLQQESGIDVEYLSSGILHVAFTEEEEADLKARLAWQAGLDMGVCWLSAEEARSMEPGLGEGIRGALYSPREGHLNSRRLVRAFAQGAARRGATFLQDTEVAGLLSSGDRITGVKLPAGDLEGDWVVLASGAWGRPVRRLAWGGPAGEAGSRSDTGGPHPACAHLHRRMEGTDLPCAQGGRLHSPGDYPGGGGLS